MKNKTKKKIRRKSEIILILSGKTRRGVLRTRSLSSLGSRVALRFSHSGFVRSLPMHRADASGGRCVPTRQPRETRASGILAAAYGIDNRGRQWERARQGNCHRGTKRNKFRRARHRYIEIIPTEWFLTIEILESTRRIFSSRRIFFYRGTGKSVFAVCVIASVCFARFLTGNQIFRAYTNNATGICEIERFTYSACNALERINEIREFVFLINTRLLAKHTSGISPRTRRQTREGNTVYHSRAWVYRNFTKLALR